MGSLRQGRGLVESAGATTNRRYELDGRHASTKQKTLTQNEGAGNTTKVQAASGGLGPKRG